MDSLSSSGYEPLSRWASDSHLAQLGIGHTDVFTAFPADPRYSRANMDLVHRGWTVYASINLRGF